MNISNVSEVIGVATKKDGTELRGTGKNGKPYTMMSVVLADGKKLNMFAPVAVGDTVALEEVTTVKDGRTYNNWNAKLIKQSSHPTIHDASQPTNAQILEAIRDVYKLLVEIRKEQSEEPMTQDKFNKEVILEDIDEEPIDMSMIPF